MTDRAVNLSIDGNACRQHVIENFSVERMVERYLEIYSACHLRLAATAA
jgi:hypothetical protein